MLEHVKAWKNRNRKSTATLKRLRQPSSFGQRRGIKPEKAYPIVARQNQNHNTVVVQGGA
ncbi:MAG: hypothetical protein ACK5NB_09325 [Flavobacteriaceae bacterium]